MGDTLVGVVATSNLKRAALIQGSKSEVVGTRFGEVVVDIGLWGAAHVAVVTRAGARHPLEPSRINYRGIVCALRSLGVRSVLSTCVVGSLRKNLNVGTLINIDQFIDFTKHRPPTLFGDDGFCFTDMTEPYCARLRRHISEGARSVGVPVHSGGCYVGVDGPRYETAAEVLMFRLLGGDVVGHTGSTEAIMAREAGLCYATVAMITNPAAGLAGGAPVSNEEITRTRERHGAALEKVLAAAVKSASGVTNVDCSCSRLAGMRQSAPWLSESALDGGMLAERGDNASSDGLGSR